MLPAGAVISHLGLANQQRTPTTLSTLMKAQTFVAALAPSPAQVLAEALLSQTTPIQTRGQCRQGCPSASSPATATPRLRFPSLSRWRWLDRVSCLWQG